MRTLQLDEIQALAHGESIPRFVGRIRKVWDQRTDEGEYGRWYLQNLIVTMADGEVQVTWTGADAFDDSWEGRTVAFECGTNDKGKPVGVARDIRHGKDGKVYKGVKVTPVGKVITLEADPNETPPATRPKPESSLPPEAKATDADKIKAAAEHSAAVFEAAWNEANRLMPGVVGGDAEELSAHEWFDLALRIANGFAIEINKVLRKERF